MLLNVTYSNTFTPYEHTEVVDCVAPLALSAVLTVYFVSVMFIEPVCAEVTNDDVCAEVTNDDVCAAVTNEPVLALVTNDAVCAAVTNEPVSALVKNEPVSVLVMNDAVASLIASIEPVKYSKLPSNSACVNAEPLVERSVKFAMF